MFFIPKTLLLSIVCVVRSDESCDSLKVDAITSLQNETIAIFSKTHVWLFSKGKQLSGPCDVSDLFDEVKGPIDAALTISYHETIVQFIGSSVYFSNGNYYTFKNLKPYQVEWGALMYLPHKGIQAKMGSNKLMKSTISAAYFDPIDSRTKLVFPDGSVLSFNFEFSPEYDTPVISNLTAELNKYGWDKPELTITAALTLTTGGNHELYLFSDDKYCSIKMIKSIAKQKCQFRPIKEFLSCDQIIKTKGNCYTEISAENPEKPIIAEADPVSGSVRDKVQSRHIGDESSNKNTGHSLSVNLIILFVYFLLILFQI